MSSAEDTRWSSSLLTSLLAGGAVAMGMLIYGIGQYFADPTLSPMYLLVQHTWHVLALWFLIYASVYASLRHFLFRPINRIYVHLYRVGAGQVSPLRLRTPVRELAEVVDAINIMIRRMENHRYASVETDIRDIAQHLRDVAKSQEHVDAHVSIQLLKAAKKLEHDSVTLQLA